MPRRRDEGRAAEAARLLAAGKTTREAAAELGVNQSTVSRSAGGAVPLGRRPRVVDEDRLRALRAEGLSWREIERRTGVPKSVAQRRLSGPA
jgi:transposase